MLPSVFGKVIHDQWRATLVWTFAAAVLSSFYLALYPAIGGMEAMQALIDALPAELRAIFITEGLDWSTPAGYLNMELFAFVLPFIVAGYGVAAGSAAIAGEEERGTLDLLLSTPVPRWRVVVEKTLVLVLGMIVLVAGQWVGLGLTALAMDIDIDMGMVASGLASGALLGVVCGTLALALGAVTGRRALSLSIAMATLVLAYVLNTMSTLVDWLEPWRPLSPVYHHVGYDPLNNGIDPAHASVLVAVALVLVALSVVAFERRDIHG
jgi:ABC-2 type transport system permease protein